MTAELLKFCNRANDHNLLHVFGSPDGQGGTPEAAAADGPVMRICQPVVEALLFDIGGNPVGLGVVSHQLILDLGHLHKPTGHCLQHSKSSFCVIPCSLGCGACCDSSDMLA